MRNLFITYYLDYCVSVPSVFTLLFNSHHPRNSRNKERNTLIFSIKSKIKEGGSRPSELSLGEIGAQLAYSQRLRWKIPFQGDRNNQNTSCLRCHAVPASLPSAHYSPPPPLVHLSELFQVVGSNLSYTPLSGVICVDVFITGLKSNPVETPSSPSTFATISAPPALLPQASSTSSSLLNIASSPLLFPPHSYLM